MTSDQVEQLIALYGSRLPMYSFPVVRKKIEKMDYTTACMSMEHLKDPTVAIILSLLTGWFGVDRFYIGDIGLGIFKLITCGGLCIWYFIDLFLIRRKTRERNLKELMNSLHTIRPQ